MTFGATPQRFSMPYAPTDRYDNTAREPIPFLYADVFHWNQSLASQLWKPARSFCTFYNEGDRGTSYKELLDDVDNEMEPPRSKARAAIFKTTAHASVARRDQEVHYLLAVHALVRRSPLPTDLEGCRPRRCQRGPQGHP